MEAGDDLHPPDFKIRERKANTSGWPSVRADKLFTASDQAAITPFLEDGFYLFVR